ncbi:MAG: FAD-dependent oxidoreductase [Polyangiaceae bacterium]
MPAEPANGFLLAARSLGGIVEYGAEVTRLRRQGDGGRVEWRDARTRRTAGLDADYVIVTIQPGLLGALDQDFTPRVREALAAPVGTPLAKVAFQARRRFWELDDQIYGGISWTDHPITQIWYPSNGIHAPKGILVGAYLLTGGETFAAKNLADRLELAIEGGRNLAPGLSKIRRGGSFDRVGKGEILERSDDALE